MDEQKIVESLKQRAPQVEEFNPAPADPVPPSGVARAADTIDLDEMTLYKIHDFFGLKYKDTDEISKQQAKYIYAALADRVGTEDYPLMFSHARDLERILGITHSGDRMYRLYQWLKLDSMRASIETQMRNIQDA